MVRENNTWGRELWTEVRVVPDVEGVESGIVWLTPRGELSEMERFPLCLVRYIKKVTNKGCYRVSL